MLNTLSRLLKSVDAEVLVDVLPFRNEDIDIDGEMRLRRAHVGEYWYAPIPGALQTTIERRIPRKLARAVSTALHHAGALPPRGLLADYDLLISAPQGPTLGDLYGAKDRIVAPLRLAQMQGLPYMVLAVSAGPFDPKSRSQKRVGAVLEGAARIVVREELSQAHLARSYPRLRNVTSAIDIVYALPWSLADKAAADLAQYRDFCAALPEQAIGACISLIPARDPGRAFDSAAYLDKFARFVDHILGTTQADLVLFPHLVFDMPALERIRTGARQPERIRIFPPGLDSDFQRDAISRLQFFISSRYHPTIFAVQAGVPFLCIKNQFKVEGMLQKVGLDGIPACWQDDSREAFCAAFDACFAAREGLKAQVAAAAERAAEQARLYRQVLSEARKAWAADRMRAGGE